jgi:cyclic beta-1,2-glucan synthetase
MGRPLSGRTGAGLDPCGALQTTITLGPGEIREIVVLLGQGEDEAQARALIAKYRARDPQEFLSEVRDRWDGLLGAVEARTPTGRST